MTALPTTTYHPWLHAYAVVLMGAVFLLVAVGGNVTSLDAGLSVEHGWTTGGYFSPLAPARTWWYNLQTRWEHSHRLAGTVVGLLTIVMMVWLWLTQKSRPWLRHLGWLLLLMVIVQGVMGAARVDLKSTTLALVHGVFGQLVLATTVVITAATSRVWGHLAGQVLPAAQPAGTLRWLARVLVGMLVLQLLLGAAVRHHKAALAIPDFPTSYGRWIPPLTQQAVDKAYANLAGSDLPARPATQGQVLIHFAHRMGAVAVLGSGVAVTLAVIGGIPIRREIVGPVLALVGLLFFQLALGATVVWSGRHPEVATLHQAIGAALLAVAVWLLIRIHLVTTGSSRHRQSNQNPIAPIQSQTA